jgi:hypothetical protein
MRRRYVYDPTTKEMVEVSARRSEALHFIQPDLPGYESPIDGRWIEGRKARRDDLRRSNSRPYEGFAAEKREADKIRAAATERLNQMANERVERAWAQLPPRMKRVLEGKAKGYDP